jgi:SAM-dependent methyltransferase
VADHDVSEYGTWIADAYDDIYGGAFDTDGAVERLADLADGGPVLELGVGTGRLALPLAHRGLEVHGVDGSSEMLDLLADRCNGAVVDSTLGDFSTVRVGAPGGFSLVVLAINTIFALPDQDAKIRCFETAAWHLRPGGRFVVEAWVPEALPAGSSLRPRTLSPGYIGLVAAEHDPSTQTLATTQIVFGNGDVRVFPVEHKYAWPFELDLMARIAGLALESRWADWAGAPFVAASTDHVSVYRAAE